MVVAVILNENQGKLWYRGRITDVLERQGGLVVHLVDYGREVTVAWACVKKLNQKFTAMECQVRNH